MVRAGWAVAEERADTGSAPANDRAGRPPAADRLRRTMLRFAQYDGVGVAGSVRYRLAQAWSQIATTDRKVIVPPELAPLIAEDITPAFSHLSPADRAHLVSVAQSLAAAGWDDDVVAAGLLHDVGKADSAVRLTVVDRGLWVILQRVWPGGSTSLAARTTRPTAGAGIWVLARHAETGAAMLADAGYGNQVCWLVEHHERNGIDDPSLQALIAADRGNRPPGPAPG